MNTSQFTIHKICTEKRISQLRAKVANPTIIDNLISKYQSQTKGAVQHIIEMCKTIKTIYRQVENNELSENDLIYFCEVVNLDRRSATFRKYMCIADRADQLLAYAEKLPSTYSTLYEITTLDSEKFEYLMNNHNMNSYITLREVKELVGKTPKQSAAQTNSNCNIVSLNISFDANTVSQSVISTIKDMYLEVKSNSDVITTIENEELLNPMNLKMVA